MSARRAVFLGSKTLGLSVFQTLVESGTDLTWTVIHPDDRNDCRSVALDFEGFCGAHAIPFEMAAGPADANDRILSIRPELVFVCGWYWLIPPRVLDQGPKFFGIHNSLLPSYRGGAPLVWAIIRGETRVGSTLFEIRPGMDDGPVYLQVAVELDEDAGVGQALVAIEEAFVAALPDAWRQIVSGQLNGVEQDHALATFGAQRTEQDGWIDWTLPAASIHNFVRAQTHPYPGAFTSGPNGKIRIWKTRPLASPHFGTPGQVVSRRNAEVVVACGGDTAIAILDATDALDHLAVSQVFPSLEVRLRPAALVGMKS